jgi:hypothetical protein
MKKIIFIEPDAKSGDGHGLDNLIEASLYFSNQKNFFFLNKTFNPNNLYIPNFVKIKKIFNTNKNKILKIFFFFQILLETIILLFHFFLKKKVFLFIKAIYLNKLTVPQYFFSFYFEYKKIDIENNDNIILYSCRTKELELIYFCLMLDIKLPNIHCRVLYPPKDKKLKNFYFYCNAIIKNKKNFFIYSEVSNIKNMIEKKLLYNVDITTGVYSFNVKNKKDSSFVIGFLGDSRVDKGFNKIPNFLENIHNNKNFNFIIQLSKRVFPETEYSRNEIIKMAKTNSRILIKEGYLDFYEFRKLLQIIDIMPIIYDPNQMNFAGSNIFFRCIANEIPMIIPKNINNIKKFLTFNSFLESESIEDYINQCIKISKNYEFYLNEAKKESALYKRNISKDPLIFRVKELQ